MRRTMLVLLLLLSACGGNANQPSSNADGLDARPTYAATRVLPTPRPRPGSDSGGQPAGAGGAAGLSEMIQRTMTAEQYVMVRDSVTVIRSSSPSQGSQTFTQTIGLEMHANGETKYYTSADGDTSMSLIMDGEQAYVRGPLPQIGAPEDRWYSAPTSDENMALLILLFTSLPPVTQALMIPGQDVSSVEAQRSEELDGQTCTVYRSEELGRLIASVPQISPTNPSGGDPIDPSFFSLAELLIWGCEDGYIHRIEHHASGEQGDEQRSIDEVLTFSQFGGPITIEVPTDATPLGE